MSFTSSFLRTYAAQCADEGAGGAIKCTGIRLPRLPPTDAPPAPAPAPASTDDTKYESHSVLNAMRVLKTINKTG